MKGTFFFKLATFVYVLGSDWLNYWFDTFNDLLQTCKLSSYSNVATEINTMFISVLSLSHNLDTLVDLRNICYNSAR